MSQIPEHLVALVRERAQGRCEYCLIPEAYIWVHEPDHIIAVQHRGTTSAENLALACFDCTLYPSCGLLSQRNAAFTRQKHVLAGAAA